MGLSSMRKQAPGQRLRGAQREVGRKRAGLQSLLDVHLSVVVAEPMHLTGTNWVPSVCRGGGQTRERSLKQLVLPQSRQDTHTSTRW